jgi:DNA-binding transcriptional ArsR family regulator
MMCPSDLIDGGGDFPAGTRTPEEAVHFGVAHRIRAEILAALHEGPASRSELAELLELPRQKLRYHLAELQKDGSIEIAEWRPVGNLNEAIYRGCRLAFYSEKAWASMSEADKQVTSALILQATWAEALSSLWAGKFHSDPQVAVIWNRIPLDARGRKALYLEQKRSWERLSEIEANSAARRISTGKQGTSYVVASLGFERSRNAAPQSQPLESGVCADSPLRVPDQAGRTVEESLGHSIGHRIRVELLAALHEGPATVSKLSTIVRQPLALTDYHVDELVKDGAVCEVETRSVRNFEQSVYAVVKLPFYSADDWQKLSPEDRQVTSAISIRAAIAEAQASLWAGKFSCDPEVMVAWNRLLLDSKGRTELALEQERSWANICDIASSAEARLASEGHQSAKMIVVTLWGFERSRTKPPSPLARP